MKVEVAVPGSLFHNSLYSLYGRNAILKDRAQELCTVKVEVAVPGSRPQ